MFRSYSALVRIIFISIVMVVVSTVETWAAGELDPTFSAAAYGTSTGTVYAVEKQADGKILVGGYFSAANSTAASSLIRLNPDGSVDPSFNTQNLFNALGIGASVWSIAVQADGKIIVGGHFFNPVGVPQPGIRRLNTDGSLDTGFTPFIVASGSIIYDIEIQNDGRIVAGGTFSGPGVPENVVRLEANGTVDPTFATQSGVTVRDLELQSDGNIMVVGNSGSDTGAGLMRRLTATGLVDPSFPSLTVNGRVEAVKIRANGQMLIGGAFTVVNGFTLGRIALINPDGGIDLTFNQNNPGVTGFGGAVVNDIEITADGKFMIGGLFNFYNGTSRRSIARLNADGMLDTSFADNSILTLASTVMDLEILATGKVVVGLLNGTFPLAVAAFNSNGSVDEGFNPIITILGRVRKIIQQSDGKILVGGEFPYVNGVKRNGLARLNADGSVDLTFTPYFNNEIARNVKALAVQADGKVLVGIASVNQVRRLNSDGSQDASFNTPFFSGDTFDIVPLPNGQTLVGGDYTLRRLNANGTNDATFTSAAGGIRKILIQPDGNILVGGTFTQVGSSIRGRIARLNASDGSLDNSFNPPGGANGVVEDFDLQSDGKIVLGGDFTSLNGSARLRIGRLFSDGTLDNSFVQTVDGTVRAIKIQADGRILIGGSMGFVQSQSRVGLSRLNSNGSLDSSFTARPNTSVYDVILQSDSKVLIGGEFILVNGASALRIARLLNAAIPARTLFDYDGDNRADISVFRPSENKWYVFRSSDSVVYQPIFAVAGDVPVPADYDGDLKTDVAIWRPSAGDWWYLASSDGTQRSVHWGASGDVPRPSDFDGDGKADFIVFRSGENNWYRLGSTGVFSAVNFGLAGDKPVTGDFDGDGKSDVAIYRPSTGDWWWQSSVDNIQRATHFGISTDIPTPADFDGDGKSDFAVYRASTGVWYILNSGNGQTTVQNFGIAEDKPVAADYDGDGRADIAVFRPSTGVWYLMRSTAGFTAMQFGISTDVPTPNAFVP